MLGWIQRNKSRTVGSIIIGMCALLMLGFGVGGKMSRGKEQYAASVDEKDISFLDFETQRQAVEQRHRQTLGAQFDTYRRFLNINQEALDNSINEVLISRFIDGLGLTTSIQTIEQQIVDSPFFQGTFTPEKYETYKQALRMSGAQIEQLYRKETLRQQFVKLVQDVSFLSKTELKAIYNNNETARTFRFIMVDPEDTKPKIELAEDSLKQYFEENAEKYRTKKAISYQFVQFKPADFIKQVEVQDDDLNYLYDERKVAFSKPAQVNLRWIKINKKSEALSKLEDLVLSQEEKTKQDKSDKGKEKAEEILAQLNDGGDFAKLAQANSQDENSAEKGGEIGWKRFDQLEPEISRAVKLLETGDHTNVITTLGGYYIVKLEDQQEGGFKDFAEVKDTLEHEFRVEESPAYSYAAAEKFYQAVNEAKGEENILQKKALEQGLAVVQTENLVSLKDTPANIPAGLTKELIDGAAGDVELVELDGNAIVVLISKDQEAKIPELEEVKEAVIADYQKSLAVDMARDKANEMLAVLSKTDESGAKKKLSDIATQYGFRTLETDAVTKTNGGTSTFPFLAAPETRASLLKLQTAGALHDQVIFIANKFYIVELASLVLPEESKFNEKMAEVNSLEEQQRFGRLFSSLLATLRAKAEIWINPSIQEQAETTPTA